MLLTLVQMEKGNAEIHTSYLTSLDIYFNAMKAFTILALIESLVVLALIKKGRGVVSVVIENWEYDDLGETNESSTQRV